MVKERYWGQLEEDNVLTLLNTKTQIADLEEMLSDKSFVDVDGFVKKELVKLNKQRDDLILGPLDEPFKKLISGIVLFVETKGGKITSIDLDELKLDAYYHLLEKLDKFKPEAGKRAFSYYQTIVKNYILGRKIKSDKLAKRNVQYIDVATLANEMSMTGDSSAETFNDLRTSVLTQLQKELNKVHLNKNFRVVVETLVQLLQDWHNLDFEPQKKEFIALLVDRSGLSQTNVMKVMTKLKTDIYL